MANIIIKWDETAQFIITDENEDNKQENTDVVVVNLTKEQALELAKGILMTVHPVSNKTTDQ